MDADWGNLDWLVAGATLILAVVAAFQDVIRRALYHPRLKLTTQSRPPDCVRVPVTETVTGKLVTNTVFLRVKVTNEGNEAATNVEVYAKRLFRRMENDWKPVDSFPSMSLVWANTNRQIFYPTIAPLMDRFCDVAHIHDPAQLEHPLLAGDRPGFPVPEKHAVIAFDVQTRPNHRAHVVPSGTYRLDVVVAGDNVRSEEWQIELTSTGKWEPEEDLMFGREVSISATRPSLPPILGPPLGSSRTND